MITGEKVIPGIPISLFTKNRTAVLWLGTSAKHELHYL